MQIFQLGQIVQIFGNVCYFIIKILSIHWNRDFFSESATKHVVLFQPYVELEKDSRKYGKYCFFFLILNVYLKIIVSETDQCPHEAGFDAYAVGIVFIRLAHMQAMSSMP